MGADRMWQGSVAVHHLPSQGHGNLTVAADSGSYFIGFIQKRSPVQLLVGEALAGQFFC